MKTSPCLRPRLVLALLLAATAANVHAHKPSDSYLTLRRTGANLAAEWHLALRDLEDAVGLDANDDGAITWDEVRARQPAVTAYALSRLHLSLNGQVVPLHMTDFLVDNHSDGAYAVLRLVSDHLDPSGTVELSYHALFDIDPLHRGLVRLEYPGATRLLVFGPDACTQSFAWAAPASGAAFLTFAKEGVWHIWGGYDHILFLLALLLPGVLRRGQAGWEPVGALRPALANVLQIVTAFTVAHSITLSLAALGLVHLPSRLVESAIAASVVLAAFNNLVPFFAERAWLVAFSFGLVHGFGFANALRDLGLRHGELAATLFGFNVGVEAGQLAIVALFVPLAFAVRDRTLYRRVLLPVGSAAIMTVAATWLAGVRVF